MSSLKTTCKTVGPRGFCLITVKGGAGDLAAEPGKGQPISQGQSRVAFRLKASPAAGGKALRITGSPAVTTSCSSFQFAFKEHRQ